MIELILMFFGAMGEEVIAGSVLAGVGGLGLGMFELFDLFQSIIGLTKFFSVVLDEQKMQLVLDIAHMAGATAGAAVFADLGGFGIESAIVETRLRTPAVQHKSLTAGAGVGGGRRVGAAPQNVLVPHGANKGQRALIKTYALPYTEDYWTNEKKPNVRDYMRGLYRLHPAMERSLSTATKMSWSHARSTSRKVFVDEAKKVLEETAKQSDFKYGGAGVTTLQDLASQVLVLGEKSLLQRIPKPGSPQFMHRELTWHQFGGADQPFWFTEKEKIFSQYIYGYINRATMDSLVRKLYMMTYRNPDSQNPPPGWEPITAYPPPPGWGG